MALTAKKVYAILKRQISDMEAKLNSPVRYRGTVATADLLPLNPDIGDMYNIESKSIYGEAGMNVAWNGVVWDTMGAPIDMSLYIKSSELADWVKQQNKPTYTAEEVGALPADTKIPSKTSDLQNDSGFLTKIPDNYLSETDKTLSVSGKAADAKTVGDKNVELLADILSKLDKNQGSENSGKIAGINESGDIVPMFPVSVDYNEETNCLEFGSDQKMELNKGINLDSTLTKTGYAADAGAVGEITNSLKEDLSNKITKFYASNQGETHITDSDNGKIQDMVLYGKSEQNQYKGINLIPTGISYNETIEVSIPKGTRVFWATDGTPALGGNFRFRNEDSTQETWFGVDTGKTAMTSTINIDAKYIDFLISEDQSVKICLGIGDDPVYEPYTGGQPSPSPDYPQEIKSVVNPTVKVTNEDGLKVQSVTLNNITLNAIPVSSGGNVTIDGKQYIADYVDVERGKYVQMIQTDKVQSNITWNIQKQQKGYSLGYTGLYKNGISTNKPGMEKTWKSNVGDSSSEWSNAFSFGRSAVFWIVPYKNDGNITSNDINAWLVEHPMDIMYPLVEPIETDLTPEENEAFKALVTNYPVTNISVTSDQLDGYTVFNYPISMANGWNYVKQQLNDNRDFIYDMDLQSAEAYVNSEYAVALTELEV